MLRDGDQTDHQTITELCSVALSSSNLVACASLIDYAERRLSDYVIDSSLAWRNLAVIAQLARCNHSPALAMAEELAHNFYDCVDNDFDIAMRDMVMAEAGGSLKLLNKHLDISGSESLYIATRASHLAAQEGDVCLLGHCVERLSDFEDGDWTNNNPHLNWRISCALQALVAGNTFDRDSLCAEARQSGAWPRYCRMITQQLGPNETSACIQCMKQMHETLKTTYNNTK